MLSISKFTEEYTTVQVGLNITLCQVLTRSNIDKSIVKLQLSLLQKGPIITIKFVTKPTALVTTFKKP